MFKHGDLFTGQIGVGLLASAVNIGIHAAIMSLLTWVAHHTVLITRAATSQFRVAIVMMTTVTVLMFAHAIEVGIWGLTYIAMALVPERGDAYYFAFVNYTTLGYGDMLPAKSWRLLGPMAAMNGVSCSAGRLRPFTTSCAPSPASSRSALRINERATRGASGRRDRTPTTM